MMLTKYFQTDNNYSMIRLLSFLVVITGLLISVSIVVLVLLKTEILYIQELIFLISVLLGFGFGGKVAQKFAEKDNNTSRQETLN